MGKTSPPRADEYPKNLLAHIYSSEFGLDASAVKFSEDVEAVLDYLFSTLGERTGEVLRMRYKGGKSLEQIGDAFSISRERARQIIVDAERRLRNPRRRLFLETGIAGMLREAKAEGHREAYEAELGEVSRKLDRLFKIVVAISGNVSLKDPLVVQEGSLPENWRELPIDTLCLSTRSYNGLRRAGISRIGQLADCEDLEILSIRNLGVRSVQEIRTVLGGVLAGVGLVGEEEG